LYSEPGIEATAFARELLYVYVYVLVKCRSAGNWNACAYNAEEESTGKHCGSTGKMQEKNAGIRYPTKDLKLRP